MRLPNLSFDFVASVVTIPFWAKNVLSRPSPYTESHLKRTTGRRKLLKVFLRQSNATAPSKTGHVDLTCAEYTATAMTGVNSLAKRLLAWSHIFFAQPELERTISKDAGGQDNPV